MTRPQKPFLERSANRGKAKRMLNFESASVNLPTFMPVGTRAAVKGLSVEQVASTGAKILLGNTYHLMLSPGPRLVEKHGGLAKMNKWAGPTLTDSGGFQVFSLAKVSKITDEGVFFSNPDNGDKVLLTPEKSIKIQHQLGADIIMAFDDVVGLDKHSRPRTAEAMERTHRWLERSIAEYKRLLSKKKKWPKLFGIVQGGLDKKLRRRSLDFIQSTEVDGIAIGGLAVGEARPEMNRILDFLAPQLDPERPRYLMGVGHPIDVRYAISRGIDMFDSVLPTRNGRHGSFWEFDGGKDHQHNIKAQRFSSDLAVLDQACDCMTCQAGYTRAYLRHLIRNKESLGGTLISAHNLRYLQRICEAAQ